VVEKMEALIRRYVTSLLNLQEKEKSSNGWDGAQILTTTATTPHDWSAIWGSFLLLSYSKTFCETFGAEKIAFESLPGLTQEGRSRLESFVVY